ncbi:DET1- AND DDB1-ASSOCIATED PROTEIN 1 [Salix viminalis]|uniref:DET1- AND DDB1-ASSOCIATED PROTEIN 1 n=1 Tax=Salix viminalis TaxID=40686 RepID=A0A9Q0NM59_SALVM|nr:DET1- AND DDB1-ASSOCIATED PROTEIN 1 [Salix viminalis]
MQLNKQKGDSSSKDVKGVAASEGSRKRGAEKALNSRASAKRGNNQIGSLQDESDTLTSDKEYYSLTVERLRALLKERGLSPKGKEGKYESKKSEPSASVVGGIKGGEGSPPTKPANELEGRTTYISSVGMDELVARLRGV